MLLLPGPAFGKRVWAFGSRCSGWGPPEFYPSWQVGLPLGLFTAVAALMEGDPGSREPLDSGRLWTRGIAIALAAVANYKSLAAFYDYLTGDVLVELPGDLALEIAVIALGALGLCVFFVLSINLLWRLPRLNRQALRLIERWNGQDPRWNRYFERRHRFHLLMAYPVTKALLLALSQVCDLLLGGVPAWVAPRVVPGRIELYLRALWEAAEEEVQKETPFWRAAPIWGRREESALAGALVRRGDAILVLGDFLRCPKENCPAPSTLSEVDCREMAFAIDRHLQDRMVFAALSGTGADSSDTDVLEERMGSYYLLLGSKNPALQPVIKLRMDAVALGQGGDSARLAFRDRVFAWLAGGQPYAEFVFDGLLATFRAARDHAGLIECCRRFEESRALSREATLDLGEAWYWYAREIDPKVEAPLAVWAMHQAIDRLFEAGASAHLDAISSRPG